MTETIHTMVFAAKEGGGNPAPVTLNADALSAEQMREMAGEFGAESAFICRPERPDCDFRFRYFVPLHEMGLCLHDTVGCATVLAAKGLVQKTPFYIETMLGRVRIDWTRLEDGTIDVGVDQFLPKVLEKAPTREELCRALRIKESDLGEGPVESVATSRFKLIVPLKSREVLDALQPDLEYLWELCDRFETSGFYPFAPEINASGETKYCARQFPNRSGYPEDPATGVAASALGAYLALHAARPIEDGLHTYRVRQGEAMGRPSVMLSDIFTENGTIVRTRLRGSAQILDGPLPDRYRL